MNNQFVSYEIATILKNKGFNEHTLAHFNTQTEYGRSNPTLTVWQQYDNRNLGELPCPLVQQAVDFIREKLDVQINIVWNKFYEQTPYQYEARPTWREQPLRPYGISGMRATYHEALSKAIEEAIKLSELQ